MTARDALRPRERLVVRLVVITVLSGLVVAGVGVILVERSARDALRAEIMDRNQLLADELATRTDERVAEARETLRLLATREHVAGLSDQAHTDLRVALRTSPLYERLVLFDVAGRGIAVAANQALVRVEDVHAADNPVAWTEGSGVRVVERFPPVLQIAVLVERPPGQPVGVLTGTLSLEVLMAHLPRPPGPSAITHYLVDGAGQTLVHPERDRVLGRETVDTAPGRGSDVITRDGVVSLVSRAPVGLGTVIVEQPEALALRAATQTLRNLMLILVAVVAAVVAAVTVTGGLLLRPLGPLADAVARLGRGERGVRVPEGGRGEVGLVAGEFNRMAAALDRRSDEVEQLQRLSLLTHSHSDRDTIGRDITEAALALMDADGCALCLTSRAGIAVETWSGLRRPDGLEGLARRAVRAAEPVTEATGAGEHAAITIPGLQEAPLGALVVVRRVGGFAPRELELGTAFAAVAGVALEQVHRLELERKLVEELQEAVDRRRALIGGITHEFRTPLACIEGFSSALLDRWDVFSDEERRALVEKVYAHGRDLDELVSRLLDFAAIERGTVLSQLGPVSVREVVAFALDGLGSVLDGRTVEQSVPDLHVMGDATLLTRTVSNLLSNAVKYSPAGTPIVMRAIDNGTQVRIDVSDQGVGMNPEEVERAFQPFWRAGHAETRSVRGLGLGLSLVAEYVRAMGGRIRVASEPQRGSTFSVTLSAADSTQ